MKYGLIVALWILTERSTSAETRTLFFFFSFLAIDYKGNFNFKKPKQWEEEVFIHYMVTKKGGDQRKKAFIFAF